MQNIPTERSFFIGGIVLKNLKNWGKFWYSLSEITLRDSNLFLLILRLSYYEESKAYEKNVPY
jgi:hypothetical protein